MSLQRTRFNNIQKKLSDYFFSSWFGPWKRISVGMISLLFGYYLGSTATASFLERIGNRPLAVLTTIIFIEVFVRLRSTVTSKSWPLHWFAIDNLRIGAEYALVLEAFKLGS